jgi:uncharacterized membrane protein
MKVLKWVGVLPISVLAMVLASIIWNLLFKLSTLLYFADESWISLIFSEIMSSLVGVAAFIYSGVTVAPSHKKETALVLTVLISLFCGASLLFINLISREYFHNLSVISVLIGAVVCYLEIVKKEKMKGSEDHQKYIMSDNEL